MAICRLYTPPKRGFARRDATTGVYRTTLNRRAIAPFPGVPAMAEVTQSAMPRTRKLTQNITHFPQKGSVSIVNRKIPSGHCWLRAPYGGLEKWVENGEVCDNTP